MISGVCIRSWGRAISRLTELRNHWVCCTQNTFRSGNSKPVAMCVCHRCISVCRNTMPVLVRSLAGNAPTGLHLKVSNPNMNTALAGRTGLIIRRLNTKPRENRWPCLISPVSPSILCRGAMPCKCYSVSVQRTLMLMPTRLCTPIGSTNVVVLKQT